MTKEQLEEMIKNNESVYDCLFLKEIKLNSNFVVKLETHSNQLHLLNTKERQFYAPINDLFSTKAQAQHYLDNGNVTRTEKLPYITWEEFKNGKEIKFMTKDAYEIVVENNTLDNIIYILSSKGDDGAEISSFKLTEENFYKAYEVCRKLFKGEKYD